MEKKIKFWDDSLLGQPPLQLREGMVNIKNWLHSVSKITIWDLLVWNTDDTWKKWDLGAFPQNLENEARSLLDALQGFTPLSAKKKDKLGWGSSIGHYSAAAGYSSLLAIPWAAPDPTIWRNLWNHPSLPKIDIFC